MSSILDENIKQFNLKHKDSNQEILNTEQSNINESNEFAPKVFGDNNLN